MLEFLDFLRTDSLDWITVTVRLVLAVLLGGFIGIEREKKGRAAGFRTHILICLGAAMTTLTSQYIVLELGLHSDLARLGAQVITGVGFIGAGTVMVAKRGQITGITTAAGIWTAAIVGLCCGAGFFEGGVIATLLVLFVELFLSKIEGFLVSRQTVYSVYAEYSEPEVLARIVDVIRASGIKILGIEVRNGGSEGGASRAVISVRVPRKRSCNELIEKLTLIEGLASVHKI